LATIGQPELVNFSFQNDAGAFYDPTLVRLMWKPQGPGATWTTKTFPGGDGTIVRDTTGKYHAVISPINVAGEWDVRWEGYDAAGTELSAGDLEFVTSASPLAALAAGRPWPYGYILQTAGAIQTIRDKLGMALSDLPDTLIGETAFLPAAEKAIMRRLPQWRLILSLTAPPTPVPTAIASAGSQLIPATYYMRWVARVGKQTSQPSQESSTVIAAGQSLSVTAPLEPGRTAYDGYVGVMPNLEFLQPSLAGLMPGASAALTTFSMSGQAVDSVQGEMEALQSAVVALTCAHLCSRFQQTMPASVKTLTYEEQSKVDWRKEELVHRQEANYYLGLIAGYTVTPPPAMITAHPGRSPYDAASVDDLDGSSYSNSLLN
jgi:hypothetical protein